MARPNLLIPQLLGLLTRRQKHQSGLLLLALLVRAATQLLGVASIAPFMGVVADPSIIQRNDWLRSAYHWGGFTTNQGFLVALGVASILILTLSNVLAAATSWAQMHYVWNVQHTLSCRIMAQYLDRPYSFFVERNSATLHQNILNEVGAVVHGVLLPTLNVIAQTLVIVALVGLLVAIDPVLAGVVVIVLGGAYGAVFLTIRRRQAELGHDRLDAHRERYKIASEAFGGIKDVKILQREKYFIERFRIPSVEFSQSQATQSVTAQLPRYALETLAFSGIVAIVLYYLQRGEGLGQVLPIVSLYAFAGYRLLPALQGLFAAMSGIRFQRAALETLYADLEEPGIEDSSCKYEGIGDQASESRQSPDQHIPFEHSIHFENVSFEYPGFDRPILENITLTLPKNTTLGIMGPSGGGKTTLVDLLLGLYQPTAGTISIDGTPLTASTIPGWRRQIGYVPQTIFLTDDTIAGNIAFGLPVDQRNIEAIVKAARIAHVHDFVASLPLGYETLVGERGVRLSGGQRQRLGIARALYGDPAVVVFDEATSSLDDLTAAEVLSAINDLTGQKTLIIIAHRQTTVARCERILRIVEGRVVD